MLSVCEEDATTQVFVTIQFAIGLCQCPKHRPIKCVSLRHTIQPDQQHMPVALSCHSSFTRHVFVSLPVVDQLYVSMHYTAGGGESTTGIYRYILKILLNK